MVRNTRSPLKTYGKNIFIAACALLMLGSYLALSPWLSIGPGSFPMPGANASLPGANTAAPAAQSSASGITAPTGFQPPAGFEPPTGFQPPAGFEPPTGFQPPAGITAPTGFQPPAGFEPPTGFTPPTTDTAASGGTASGGFQLPAGMTPPSGGFPAGGPAGGGLPIDQLRLLVPLAGAVGLFLSLLSGWRPRFNRLATNMTFVAGLASLAYYVAFFAFDAVLPLPFNLVDLVNAGFWMGLVGSVGLFLQLFIPRPSTEIADDQKAHLIVPQTRRSGMSVMQNLGVAVDALLANKMRSGLTMLGIIIGVASVVSLLSVGQGAQTAVTKRLSSTGLNLLTITPGVSSATSGPPAPGGGGAASTNVETLTYSDAQAIERSISGLTAVLAQYTGSLKVISDEDNIQTTILGTVESYAATRNITIDIGRYFTAADRETNARVVVLGQQAAKDLFGGLNPIGRTVRISSKQFQVIGVLAKQDSGFGSDPNLQIHLPITTAYRQLFNARQTGSSEYKVSSIVVSVDNLDTVDATMSQITTLLRDRHRLKTGDDDDFSILDQQSLLDTASTITGILTVLLGAIASVSLLVGGIGIMNIMLVSVTERTKEIGLRKAIGARRSHILQQFLIETIFLSLLGGVLGVLLGVGIALIVNASGVLTATISLSSIALGLGFSAVVGIFFGVYPANQAAALEPIEALRYE